MNCKRCHHIDQAHEPSDKNRSLVKAGKCLIPQCSCPQYIDPIEEIDEDLL
ncbi:Uncharacterised protein [uncultured archaeon]|nr:Uncharacterised protein [uncultured archaeon]